MFNLFNRKPERKTDPDFKGPFKRDDDYIAATRESIRRLQECADESVKETERMVKCLSSAK